MKVNKNQLMHLKQIKTLWENPDVDTPGGNMEEFAMKYAKGLDRVNNKEPQKTDIFSRYMSYFK